MCVGAGVAEVLVGVLVAAEVEVLQVARVAAQRPHARLLRALDLRRLRHRRLPATPHTYISASSPTQNITLIGNDVCVLLPIKFLKNSENVCESSESGKPDISLDPLPSVQ